MEGELFDRKILEQLTAGALRRACRSKGAQEDFLDPESGRDPTKEDLLAWLGGRRCHHTPLRDLRQSGW